MSLRQLSEKIADRQRNSYLIGLVIGLILYAILLFFSNWNPISLITGAFSIELSVVSGIIMRFLSGFGLSLTYATFCSLMFKYLSPMMKGSKIKAKAVITIVLIIALGVVVYGIYTIWSALYLSRTLTDLEFLSMLFGVWSLMIMVYVLPVLKGEYSPEIEQTGVSKAKQKAGNWKFSVWKGYKSHLRKDYGTVYEKEFERFGLSLFMIRAILSGLLLLPISLILVNVTPLAILSIVLWIRMFSLNHKNFSDLERVLLILVTLSVALLTTLAFFQPALITYNTYFDVSYGIGLLSGISLLFVIILRR
jgi:MFS family permease